MLVKALYQWQIAGHDVEEVAAQFRELADFERCDGDYFLEVLDVLIVRHAVRAIEQLDPVGRAILLIGLAELKFRNDVPPKVAINEAIELAKRYGPTDSFRFVNAVLDKTARDLKQEAQPEASV